MVGCKRGKNMPNMRQMIMRYMRTVTLIMVAVVLMAATVVQILSAQYYARESAEVIFAQIRQIVQENQNKPVEEQEELSYIFSLLCVNTGVSLYAIDAESGTIVGCTNIEDVGKACEEVGFEIEEILVRGEAYHTHVNGVQSFCVFSQIGNNLVGRVVTNDTLYHNIQGNMITLGICLISIALIMVISVTNYINKTFICAIYDINDKLRAIAEGNLDETVDVQVCREFAELSKHSNEMINSLLAGTDKISYVLNKTDVPIGVYEYSTKMTKVRFTEHVPEILSLDTAKEKELLADSKRFAEFIAELQGEPLEGEEDVYFLNTDEKKYIRMEEIFKNNDILGIVIDVTEEIEKRKQIEEERDTDILTGLYNRRGLENKLANLFAEPEKMKQGAMIMADADCLKEINDKYGHDKGDIYLQKIAGVLNGFEPDRCVVARQGGDEFVLFLYGYDDAEELQNTIKTLSCVRDNSIAYLGENISVPLKFSYGYCLLDEESDFEKMLAIADARMYENKQQRKTGRVS